jgi:hypothetical protein
MQGSTARGRKHARTSPARRRGVRRIFLKIKKGPEQRAVAHGTVNALVSTQKPGEVALSAWGSGGSRGPRLADLTSERRGGRAAVRGRCRRPGVCVCVWHEPRHRRICGPVSVMETGLGDGDPSSSLLVLLQLQTRGVVRRGWVKACVLASLTTWGVGTGEAAHGARRGSGRIPLPP